MEDIHSNLQYNTERPKLILKEYGRNVQKLIEHVTSLGDDVKRNEYSKTLVELMKMINPKMKESPEYAQRLWDDLYIMSQFKMEVDSPYPMPAADAIHKKPEKIPYTYKKVKLRHYGKNIELMLQKALEVEDDEERFVFTVQIAKMMKSFYVNWNKDNVEDEVILENIDKLTNRKLKYDKEKILNENLLEIQMHRPKSSQNNNFKRKNNSGNYRQNNNQKRRRFNNN
ncbi:DUF4290 domain-containing protein [Aureibacter tunicatorum]|uniref:DUF4290 domain-containing protein n=1 Tax=Aureibacter tunicatorum TaxID=866807 RepID=A0AAE3XRU9_9BACT|nr:DUF4290 domain-containing protein [Aureibacter tunicatorum]MDR6240923.1 hypothetical protein [Aureibacter tunicatorum]BDD03703.1 hypothetical protein AUTU_11860 [Aureibacter tunicatorum]